MRKIFTSIFAGLALLAMGQTDEPNVMIIHYTDGSSNQINLDLIDHLEFTNADDPDGPEVPLADPKVGDYFYSDGTWSDGGLISIDPDGQNALWAETKPAPLAGKTVIGIVFCTDPDRIAQSEKDRGFTHGYVIGCKNITDPKKINYEQYPESVWFGSQYACDNDLLQVNPVSKACKTCYGNINGYTETVTMFDKNSPEYYYSDIPMFYYGVGEYAAEAPSNTSGWFIPSIGQMWDCVANFCSGEVAAFLAENRTNSYDFTYYCSKNNLSEAPFKSFMKPFELVAAEDKDDITVADNGSTSKNRVISLGCSTRYDDESRLVIMLGMDENTTIEGMAAWFDEEAHARPILAF